LSIKLEIERLRHSLYFKQGY